jgi:hypothetical protein
MSSYRAPDTVASETLDGEAIVIDLVSGAYFSFRGWSTWAWQALRSGVDSTVVDAEFAGVGGAADFVDTLVGAGLLVPDDRPVPAPLPPRPDGPVTALEFDRFDDMADMIQLDPVHDVDQEAGWPRAADG